MHWQSHFLTFFRSIPLPFCRSARISTHYAKTSTGLLCRFIEIVTINFIQSNKMIIYRQFFPARCSTYPLCEDVSASIPSAIQFPIFTLTFQFIRLVFIAFQAAVQSISIPVMIWDGIFVYQTARFSDVCHFFRSALIVTLEICEVLICSAHIASIIIISTRLKKKVL